MQYRKNIKNGDMLSALGFGYMRLPMDGKQIDENESIALAHTAYEKGINYFDTAYVYSDGKSELILGKAVKSFRDKIKIATKLPLMPIKSNADFDRLFNTSLQRLQTTYIDYYLIHCILDFDQYMRMVGYGLNEWISAKKASGEIKNIGFSFHGRRQDFISIIDSYDWDFCQIQYNYLDINFQAGRIGLNYATDKGIPVFIMEPLRGGSIVNKQPLAVVDVFKKVAPQRSLADWGLRWVANHPQAIVTLSGMSSREQLEQNLATFETALPSSLSDKELSAFETACDALSSYDRIGCTGCGYCQPCPVGVDIPACFTSFNSRLLAGKLKSKIDYIATTGGITARPANASLCIECGKCEKKCPQNILIRQELKRVAKKMELPFHNSILKLARKIKKV